MFLRFLYLIGLTNLSEEQVEIYENNRINPKPRFSDNNAPSYYLQLQDLFLKGLYQINISKEKTLSKLDDSHNEVEVEQIAADFLDDYMKLFVRPTIDILNAVREAMVEYIRVKYKLEENFRVTVKLIHHVEDNSDINKWEFSNLIWDTPSWESTIKYSGDGLTRRHQVSSSVDIQDIALRKKKYFLCNDIKGDYSGAYKSHDVNWNETYNAKYLVRLENLDRKTLYGFMSVDTLNVHGIKVFGTGVDVLSPREIITYASNSISWLLFELESYHKDVYEQVDIVIKKIKREEGDVYVSSPHKDLHPIYDRMAPKYGQSYMDN